MLGAIMGAVGLGGSALSAYGTYKAGRQAKDNAYYNAKLKEQQAKLTREAMATETAGAHRDARRMKATQEAGYASSGAVVGEGTPLLVLAEQAGAMERDILNDRRTRMLEEQGLQSEARMLRYEGKQAKKAGTIGAVSTLLGGAGQAGLSMLNSGGSKTKKKTYDPGDYQYDTGYGSQVPSYLRLK